MLPNKKLTHQDVVAVFRKSGVMLLAPVVICTLAALIYSSRLPNVYQSEMLIQVVPQRVPDVYVRSTVTMRTEDRIDALHQQVTSRTQLERLIESFNLYPDLRARLPLQDVVERVRTNIDVQVVRPARNQPVDAFYVRFSYTDPVTAARVTERLGTLFVDENAMDRGELARATNEFLDAQLEEARQRLEAQDQKLKQFRERNAGRLPTQLEFNMQAIQSTQLQLQALVESAARDRDRKMMLERLYNDAISEPSPLPETAATRTPGSGESAAAAASTLPLPQRVEMARAAVAALKQRLKSEHPDLKRAMKTLADLERQAENEVKAAPGSGEPPASSTASVEELRRRDRLRQMRAEIESLDRQLSFKETEERRLRDSIAEYQKRIEAVPGVESEFTALTRDYETLQASFNDLLRKSEASKVSVDLERRQIGEQFRVVDAPRVPTRPVSPLRVLYSGGGLAVGLLIGLALVAVPLLWDSTFKSEADVVEVLHLPVLALVPLMVTAADRRRQLHRSIALRVAVGLGGVVAAGVFWALQLWKFAV